jgi:hypothetical protein
MKSSIRQLMLAVALCSLAIVAGCGATLHKPTTEGNAGTTALIAYSVAGFTAGQYFKLPLCGTPAVQPCKTQAVNDRLLAADTAAHDAAVAADRAGNNPAAKAKAAAAKKQLEGINGSPEVKSQVDLIKPSSPGGAT